MSFVPKYSGYNASTGQFLTSAQLPATPAPYVAATTAVIPASTVPKITTTDSVSAQFKGITGRDPTAAELKSLDAQIVIGNRLSPAAVETAIKALPSLTATSATDNTPAYITSVFNQKLGRAPTPAELATYTRATIPAVTQWVPEVPAIPAVLAQPAVVAKAATATTPAVLAKPAVLAQPGVAAIPGYTKTITPEVTGARESLGTLLNYISTTPEAISAANTIGQAAYIHSQSPAATPTAVASIYKDILHRAPTAAELSQTTASQLNPDELKTSLQNTPEFSTNLTDTFVPKINYDASGVASIRGAQPQADQPTGLSALNSAINAQVSNKLTTPSNFNFAAPASVQATSPIAPKPTTPTIPKQDAVSAQLSAALMQQQLQNQAAAQGLGSFVAQASGPGTPYSAGTPQFAHGGLSSINGQYNLGGYSDGGRLLRGPGDGVSDSIPAQIGDRQPARLADGEFVIPARIVSELGNGSTDAGARRLYAMMDRIQHARRKSIGKNKVAVNSRADKFLPK